MKRIIQLLFLLTLLVTISILLSEHLTSNELQYKEDDYSTATLKSDQVDKQLLTFLEGDIYSYIDKTSDELKEDFGEPERKDLSAYGYTWWVYHVEGEQYVQFGIEDNHIVTVYTTGDHVSMSPLEIGQTVESLKDHFSIKEEVTYNNGSSFYTFRLNEEELQAQPLIKLSDHLFLQCY